jgi:hypothetical protein
MLKYFALFLISLTCVAGEPKFHFKDCVKVVSGFYKDCKGKVDAYNPGSGSVEPYYEVDIEDCKGSGFYADFDEDQLEACKK